MENHTFRAQGVTGPRLWNDQLSRLLIVVTELAYLVVQRNLALCTKYLQR